jgi:hypothetical protein
MIFQKSALAIGLLAFALTLGCAACGTHDASDPTYGAMYKQATHDRITGNEFWGSNRQKNCTAGGAVEVCTPVETNVTSSDSN